MSSKIAGDIEPYEVLEAGVGFAAAALSVTLAELAWKEFQPPQDGAWKRVNNEADLTVRHMPGVRHLTAAGSVNLGR
jgi:hypothetical protein